VVSKGIDTEGKEREGNMKVYLPVVERRRSDREHVLELPVPPPPEPKPQAEPEEAGGGEVVLDLFHEDDPFVI
tara:strand:+ start:211 stop:429 length:219 start_codon:yes stop_codon:yes gene_type:complete